MSYFIDNDILESIHYNDIIIRYLYIYSSVGNDFEYSIEYSILSNSKFSKMSNT